MASSSLHLLRPAPWERAHPFPFAHSSWLIFQNTSRIAIFHCPATPPGPGLLWPLCRIAGASAGSPHSPRPTSEVCLTQRWNEPVKVYIRSHHPLLKTCKGPLFTQGSSQHQDHRTRPPRPSGHSSHGSRGPRTHRLQPCLLPPRRGPAAHPPVHALEPWLKPPLVSEASSGLHGSPNPFLLP